MRLKLWLRHLINHRLFILSIILTTVFLSFSLFNTYKGELKQNSLKKPSQKLVNTTLPIILLWTPYFGGNWIHEDGFQTHCLRNRCNLQTNRGYLPNAKAVLFHWKDVNLNDLPSFKYKDQKWVLYNMESPENTMHLRPIMQSIQHSIDWMMSYRSDSDVKSVYGYTIKLNHTKKMRIMGKKSKEIAWMVSNCNTPGNREDFAKELASNIKIDIYGRCGHLKCSKDKYYECLRMVNNDYKFYLSFENSICKDYVTEKLFRVMAYDVIPIVFGGANYKHILPPNSFIDALNFSNPKKLSEFISQVSKNESLYLSFLEWKKNYKVFSSIGYDLCFLCDKIVNSSKDRTKHKNRDLIQWWYTDAKCTSWKQV